MFWACPSVQNFWRLFVGWWKIKCSQIVVISKSNVLDGELGYIENRNCLNYILLVAKSLHFSFLYSRAGTIFYKFEFLLPHKLAVVEAVENKRVKKKQIRSTRGKKYLTILQMHIPISFHVLQDNILLNIDIDMDFI